ncbi:MAG: hypothetical protein WKG07_23150 [Hymenobacter sp.]
MDQDMAAKKGVSVDTGHEHPANAAGQLLRLQLHPLRADVQGDGAGRAPSTAPGPTTCWPCT